MNTHPQLESREEITIYSSEELSRLNPHRIPKHIAIVMDGNRTWALKRGLPPMMGHWEGAAVLIDLMRAASELGIKAVTAYSFSTENWRRERDEVESLMDLFESYLIRQREAMVKDGIRLDTIGNLERLPDRVKIALHDSKQATKNSEKIDLVLAINYGGRDEIRRATIRLIEEYRDRPFDPSSLTEEQFAKHLDTARWSDPELFIRTKGEMRISNFLPWQISYSEIYVTDVLWPDFSPKELYQAVLTYQERKRNFGR